MLEFWLLTAKRGGSDFSSARKLYYHKSFNPSLPRVHAACYTEASTSPNIFFLGVGWLTKGNSAHPEPPLPGEGGSHPPCKPLEGDMTPTLGGVRRKPGSSSPAGQSGRSAVEGCARSQLRRAIDVWCLKTSWRSAGQRWSDLRVATKAAGGARGAAHPTLRRSKHKGRHKGMGGEGWEERDGRKSSSEPAWGRDSSWETTAVAACDMPLFQLSAWWSPLSPCSWW